ncbi:MAG: hypothetical protein AVDCRST_MAG91-395 [uncultured Sphingomonadaceae bacterium]|uniref:Uncharacterized protein n=1 Tax=uncultured Sphingomonadaceae bacterium TaxID=169976 RepID=A0A6J4SCA2_9SPHN|nr:MAG: hypothetical protein AVDCRST_MAG91-395 [uncultured Sphingomonadaceae bacterium]
MPIRVHQHLPPLHMVGLAYLAFLTGESVPRSATEAQHVVAGRIRRQIALTQDVHADQRLEGEAVREFEADDVFEDEREGGRRRIVRSQADAKGATFGLAFALRGRERAFAEAVQS